LEYKSIKDLPLKVFFEIAETGNVKLLGEDKDAVLIERWEQIIIEYGKDDNNQAVNNVVEKSEQLFTQGALFCEIKGMLLYLVGAESGAYVERLNELGYKINADSHEEKIKSIQLNDRRANNISTRMQILQNEIDSYSDGKKATFDSVMAWLSSQLGFEPKEDITVLRYLEYKKQINERNKAKRSNNRRSVPMA
jgi:hypothetical protein